MILPIQVIGTNVLRQKAKNIDENYENLQQLIDDMFQTMEQSDGIGLAAPQIGKSINLFVINGNVLAEENPELEGFKKVFINPEIIEFHGEDVIYSEGCLSIPGFFEEVIRKDGITIKYYDENFKPHTDKFEGIKSRIVQHEYDHLDGILFTDRLSALRKKIIKNKIVAISKGKFSQNYKVVLGKK